MFKPNEDTDSYYPIRDGMEVPKTHFKIKHRKRTLSVRAWRAAFSQDGHLKIEDVLNRIQRWGVHPNIRGEVWEFLLGCFDPNSTFDKRNQLRQQRREQYAIWKDECRKMMPTIGSGRIITAPIIDENGEPIQDPIVLQEANPDTDLATLMNNQNDTETTATYKEDQATAAREDEHEVTSSEYVSSSVGEENSSYDPETLSVGYMSSGSGFNGLDNLDKLDPPGSPLPMDKKEIQWKLTLHQIGLDVVRTDRTLVFYEKPKNLSKLWDVLAVYAWIDKDVGYCQGMSDLCSPMLMLFQEEADAFWCFERLMRRLRGNFRGTARSVGVEKQLQSLATVTQVVDPKLHHHLETLGGGEYHFAVRMLMVLFRRELSFGDALFLWEMMWGMEYDPLLFHVYEESESDRDNNRQIVRGKVTTKKQFGKFERNNMKSGISNGEIAPISIFLVAGVLKGNSTKLLREARGLDDVVKMLNGLSGNLDAKKACSSALKLHRSYLRKAKKSHSG